jgi:hypothetical protein
MTSTMAQSTNINMMDITPSLAEHDYAPLTAAHALKASVCSIG